MQTKCLSGSNPSEAFSVSIKQLHLHCGIPRSSSRSNALSPSSNRWEARHRTDSMPLLKAERKWHQPTDIGQETMRITTIAAALFLTASASLASGAAQLQQNQTITRNLYIDDISRPDLGAIFETTFNADATCEGLTLTRWTQHTAKENAVILGQSHWAITLNGPYDHDESGHYRPEGTYSMSTTLLPGTDNIPNNLSAMRAALANLPSAGLSEVSVQEVVRKVCSVAKQTSAQNTFKPEKRQSVTAALSRRDIPTIAKAANGAVVSVIMSDKEGQPITLGTGFLISKDGRVVTNYHVIENGISAIVKLPDGTVFSVDGVLAADKTRDIAIIKAHGENFRTLPLGNSDQVQVGEEIVAIGNPLSLESTVSNGIVSGIRTVEEEGGKFLQITAPISHGSSGGPLFNMFGEVIGINSMFLEGGENLNFAIPINDVKRLLLNQSANLQNFPNEIEPAETPKETRDEGTPSQQKACDEQAEKFARYQRQEYEGVPLKNGYVNHYDATANKCYVETVLDFGDGKDRPHPSDHWYEGKFYGIHDAFFEGYGGPTYGSFVFHEDGVQVAGGECNIYPQGSATQLPAIKCRSEEEFNDLALKYFGIVRTAAPTISANMPIDRQPPTTPANPPPAPLPSNTKIAATPPDPAHARQEQLWQDIKYCYENPANKLQLSDGTLVGCGEINAAAEAREKECKSKTGPKDEAEHCKGFLKTYKDLKAGILVQ